MPGIDPAVMTEIEQGKIMERASELRAAGLMGPAGEDGINPTDLEVLRRSIAAKPLSANLGEVLVAQAVADNRAAPNAHYGLSGGAGSSGRGGFRF